MDSITYMPIGVVRSPNTDPTQTPKQTESARGIAGRVELNAELAGGLKDLAEFDYIWLVVHMHKAIEGRALWETPATPQGNQANEALAPIPERPAFALEVVTSKAESPHGVFATRAPFRPNAIGLSLVRLARIEGATLHIEDVDLLDGTPVLDIKPYVPKLDNRETQRIGWFARRLK